MLFRSERDAYREGTSLAVMACHVRLGNRKAAVVEYERLRSLLRSELDSDPLPETREAAQRLLAGSAPGGEPEDELEISPEPIVTQRHRASAQVRLKVVAGGSRP